MATSKECNWTVSKDKHCKNFIDYYEDYDFGIDELKFHPFEEKYENCMFTIYTIVNEWLNENIPAETTEFDLLNTTDEFSYTDFCIINKINYNINKPKREGATFSLKFSEYLSEHIKHHLTTVKNHKIWVKKSKLLFERLMGIKASEKLERAVLNHDLSKYTHREIIGYALRFPKGKNPREVPKQMTAEEYKEWSDSQDHHYSVNKHHPEYFYVDSIEDIEIKQSMVDPKSDEPLLYIYESIFDMLACNGERFLNGTDYFDLRELINIKDEFLARYHYKGDDNDRKKVVSILMEMNKKLDNIGEDIAYYEKLYGKKVLYSRKEGDILG